MLTEGRDRRAFGKIRMTAITVASLFHLIRIHAGLTAVALALVAALLTRATLDPRVVIAVAAAVLFATSAGNALNDVYDNEIDSLNKPDRPIPAGQISPAVGKAIAAVLFALAIVTSASISGWCLAVALVNISLLIIYAKYSKRLGLTKNLLVGALVGSVALFGATEPGLVNGPVAVLGACAALTTVAREIMKDIEDRSGDERCCARTLPIATSDGFAYFVAYACLAAALALATIPYFTLEMDNTYAALVMLGGLVFVTSMLARHARTRQLIVMAGSVIQLAAFYFGRG